MKKINSLFFPISCCILIISSAYQPLIAQKKSSQHILWQIGKADKSALEFALSPNGFKNFVGKDFGYEDKYFLVGYSKEKNDFPYVIPGPADTWGGTWPTAGWRTNQVNILFGLGDTPANGEYKLIFKVLDYAKKFSPLIKVSINGQDEKVQLGSAPYNLSKQVYPRLNEPITDTASITGDLSGITPETIEIPIRPGIIKNGGNYITITVVEGSWIMFDQLSLIGPGGVILNKPGQMFARTVRPADYELATVNGKVQPLLINVEYLEGSPKLSVELDGKIIFKETLEKGHYEFEAPMPAVTSAIQSGYKILENGKVIENGIVKRSKQKLQTLADYVDTRLGTAH
ncbi:MAG: polysaccharide lyase family protein, partial [Ginsengibacter sp.]